MKNMQEEFHKECQERIASYANAEVARTAHVFMVESTIPKYSYKFSFLGRPSIQYPVSSIQYPQDMVDMQVLIWQAKPDLMIESSFAHGGSLIMNASMLAMLDYCDAVETRKTLDPQRTKRRVLGIDIDIRTHNRAAIEAHPMARHIDMIQGSSIAADVINQVYNFANGYKRIMVSLDSNHTHEHVLAELEAYAPLVSKGSYCCVFDTIIEDLPDGIYPSH
jgi:cephalosporin hydroxylase